MMVSTRRTFLKQSFLTLALLVFSKNKLFARITPLNTLSLLQEDLFPLIKKLDSNSSSYIVTVLNHYTISNAQKQFIRNGVKWLNEEAVKYYKNTYTKLTFKQRQELLTTISKEYWGESFIYSMLTYIMESVLGDPVYNINKNELGWKWIGHETGYPQPTKAFL